MTENNLQIFNSPEFGQIRTVELNGKIYFVGKDVAEALGYVRPRKAIQDHCKGVLKQDILTNGGLQEMTVIPEGDVIRLATKSKLPSAEKFESWVFDEVIPQIRQTGST
jgi:prophage antirepressor-like protein